jgi:hypothetical protein
VERGGQSLDLMIGKSPYTAPFTRIGRVRSAGITDLRHGNVLDADWEAFDRFEHREDVRRAESLPEHVRSYAIAGTTGTGVGDLTDRTPGAGVVPVNSALGVHERSDLALRIPATRQWIGRGMNHFDLLGRPEGYGRIRDRLDASDDLPTRR